MCLFKFINVYERTVCFTQLYIYEKLLIAVYNVIKENPVQINNEGLLHLWSRVNIANIIIAQTNKQHTILLILFWVEIKY